MRTIVCTQSAQQCTAVRLVVCSSARGRVRLSGSAAVCGSEAVRKYVAVQRHCTAVCDIMSGSVWQ